MALVMTMAFVSFAMSSAAAAVPVSVAFVALAMTVAAVPAFMPAAATAVHVFSVKAFFQFFLGGIPDCKYFP